MGRLLLAMCVVSATACGDDGAGATDAASSSDAQVSADATASCNRMPRPADATRKVVIAHPYDDSGAQADDFEVYELTSAGALTTTGVSFTMSRDFDGVIQFTPDGKLGFAVHDDGSLGIFRLNDDDSVDVLHAAYDANGADGFYASSAVISRSGDKLFVLSSQWRKHGGGIHQLTINCDDSVRYDGLMAAAKLPYGMHQLPGGDQVVVVSDDVLDSPQDQGAHLLAWSGAPSVQASADIFGDTEAIVSATGITADGRFVLAGDNNSLSKNPDRVAIAELGTAAITPVTVISPLRDPTNIIASPDNDAILIVSAQGDALFELDYDPANATTPISLVGELSYSGAGPQLPAGAVLITRGALRGRVVIAENTAIRQVQFESGSITDLGPTDTGSGFAAIVGAIGVQP